MQEASLVKGHAVASRHFQMFNAMRDCQLMGGGTHLTTRYRESGENFVASPFTCWKVIAASSAVESHICTSVLVCPTFVACSYVEEIHSDVSNCRWLTVFITYAFFCNRESGITLSNLHFVNRLSNRGK